MDMDICLACYNSRLLFSVLFAVHTRSYFLIIKGLTNSVNPFIVGDGFPVPWEAKRLPYIPNNVVAQ